MLTSQIARIPMLLAVVAFASAVTGQALHPKEPHQHPDAAKLKNPVAADAASLEAGKKVYTEQCAECHGDAGKGDGSMAAYTGDPPPSDLTDTQWKHGSSDGEIYTVIHDGIEGTAMKDFKSDLKETEIWQVVNYVKSLAPAPAKAH